MIELHKAFIAYPSRDSQLLTVLREGIAKATAKATGVQFEPWEFNDIAGTPLISPIIEKIESANFIIADVTYLNLNVVYEIGYAIGKGKRVL